MVELLSQIERHPQSDLVFYSSTGKSLSDMTLSAAMKRLHEADVRGGGPGFCDERSGKPAVPHGLRSSFRDWAAECGFERDMAELQLAHNVGSEVERAYRRSDMLERRRAMLEAWERFLSGREAAKVVTIGGAA
jgi:integrase